MIEESLRNAVILVVDDEQPNLDLLESCLAEDGYQNVTGVRDPREVAATFDRIRPDLILLDLHMPFIDGFTLLKQLGTQIPSEEYLPILVLTADATDVTKQRALSGGANDFLTKPLDLTEVSLRIRNLLQTRFLHQSQRQARRAAEEASNRAICLASATQVLVSSFDYHTTLSVLSRTLVPMFADYCVVDVMRPNGEIVRLGVAHTDPEKEALLRSSEHAQPNRLPRDHPVVGALTQGRRTLAQEITREMVDAVVANEEHRKVIERLAPTSLIAVPLQASREIHGALVLAYTDSGRSYGLEDLELAIEIARRAALTIENARLFNQAQQASRARDELLAIVAHDLRNPLSTIKMGSGLLKDTATTDAQRRYAELVTKAADRMHRLIEDLLDVTRIESGKLRVELRPFPVASLINEAVAMLSPLAGSRNISLLAETDCQTGPVMLDSTRIMQVLSNLLGNALKFTPEGGKVCVACEVIPGELKVCVSDTGPGIPRDQIPHIFGRLWQASDKDMRGIGLGLSIVRGIVEAHGGRVWVESEVGQGTSFYFTLRFPPTENADQPPVLEQAASH